MRPKKYPLEPLAHVRAKQVDDAARALGEAARAREEASHKRALAEKRRDEAEAAARALRDAEQEALERGELTVADLMRGDAWGVRVKAEQEELARRAADSAAKEGAARKGESSARAHVAGRKADAELVERDRARWTDAERRRADAKEEEAAADGWRPKRS
jgi:hypothetical protein